MKRNIVNEIHAEGYLYEHELEKKVSKKGVEYIGGTISLATDEECSNIVKFYFTYVTPTFSKSGSSNPNYKILENIINSGTTQTVMGAGKENSLKIRMNSTIALNEFYDKDDNLVSQVRNEGGFINIINAFSDDSTLKNIFKADVLITSIFDKEADEEKNIEEHSIIKGAIFNNYTKALLPISFSVYNPNAINYFKNFEPSSSNPIFTKIWGQIVSKEFVTKTETESAFGEKLIEERRSTRKEYVITGAQGEIYDWDSEDTILASEVKEAMSQRELHLAEIKKRQEEYKNSATAPASSTAAAPVAAGDFKF